MSEQKSPSELSMNVPNAETLEALREVEAMKKNPLSCKSYNSFSDLLNEVMDE